MKKAQAETSNLQGWRHQGKACQGQVARAELSTQVSFQCDLAIRKGLHVEREIRTAHTEGPGVGDRAVYAEVRKAMAISLVVSNWVLRRS